MGKFKDNVNNAGLRTGNTIATPFRIVGEWGNALANVLRQWQSSAKNTAEVGKQTIDALVDNFTNFSKVEGKWYQRLVKWTINLASAVTRRPAMILGAGFASSINQWMLQPFKKLLYTPGKMFKWMRNATRIFSKKKGFDFVSYDTHETGKDTRVQKIYDKKLGFLWAKKWSSEKPSEAKPEAKPEAKKEEKKPEPKKEITKSEAKKEEKKPESKPEISAPKKEVASSEKPKTMDELKQQHKLESEKKSVEETKRTLGDWKTMDEKFKKEYSKEYEKMFGWTVSEESVVERGKKNKKWENMEQLLTTLKKENPVMAGFIEDEILAKQAPATQAA